MILKKYLSHLFSEISPIINDSSLETFLKKKTFLYFPDIPKGFLAGTSAVILEDVLEKKNIWLNLEEILNDNVVGNLEEYMEA